MRLRGCLLLLSAALAAQEPLLPCPEARPMETLEGLEPLRPKDPSEFWALPPVPPPTPMERCLAGGLLDPAWFGPTATLAESPEQPVDFLWLRPGARLDRPLLHLVRWDLGPRLSRGDALDQALAGERSEGLQRALAQCLEALPELRLATKPSQTPYHLVGRVVGATHIRQGAQATFGLFAGLPSVTWDFKVVDVRTGSVLLATHHRSLGGNPYPWADFITEALRRMGDLPAEPEESWKMPKGSEDLPEGGSLWTATPPPLLLGPVALRPWHATSGGTGGLWGLWAHGMGRGLALGMPLSLIRELETRGLAVVSREEATLLLDGQVVNVPSRIRTRFLATLREKEGGRAVLRLEFPAPMGLNPCPDIATRILDALLRLRAPASTAFQPRPPAPAPPPPEPWPFVDRLASIPHAPGLAWIDPGFRLMGRSLQVGDWQPPLVGRDATFADRAFSDLITHSAPGWLHGVLASQAQGVTVSREAGELRIEGRVVQISETDLSSFGARMGAALTFGLSAASSAVLQVRIVEIASGRTVLLIQKEVESLKAASSGTDYKTMKWLAQDLAPWLLEAGGCVAAKD